MNWRASMFLSAAWVGFAFFLMAHDFGAIVAKGGSPIQPEQYGDEVYAIPALVWVAMQQYASYLAIVGALFVAAGGRWTRLGAFAAGLGFTALAALFLLFAILSADQPQGALLHAASKYPALMICGLFAVLSGRVFFWGDENE